MYHGIIMIIPAQSYCMEFSHRALIFELLIQASKSKKDLQE